MQGRGNALARGAKLAGSKYVIDGTLGEGGFGITYRATDTMLGRTVAIKELCPLGSERRGGRISVPIGYTAEKWGKVVADFLREAQTLARLDHPAIVPVHEYLRENNTAYMVMKFVDGVTMTDMVQRSPLPEAEALRYIAEVGAALSVLHTSGVLHRDIKPPNIIVNQQGHAVLVDFGAARDFQPDVSLTHTVIYTPGFAPPEQMMGKAKRGPQTDIYALAATCFYILTGEVADDADEVANDRRLSPRVRASLARALNFDPKSRPATAAEFVADLTGGSVPAASPVKLPPAEPPETPPERVVSPQPVYRPATWQPQPTPQPKHSVLPLLAGGVVTLVVLVTAISLFAPVVDMWTSTTLSGHTSTVYGAVFSPDGSLILTASDDHTARLWDGSGKPLVTLSGHTGPVFSPVFSPDGGRILTASYGEALLWDTSGKPLATLSVQNGYLGQGVFSPDGSRILTASDDHTARLWDSSGKLLATLSGHTSAVNSAMFSPDGGHIITASDDYTARLWDSSGKPLATLNKHTGTVESAVFSPDGSLILTASGDKTARLWDSSGKPLATLSGHTAQVLSALFSPDGSRILTASYDGTARLWDTSGNLLATLRGHTSTVWSAVFSPDGSRILTASYDGTARLWDSSGKPLATLSGHTGPLDSAVFSSDGSRILTASLDHTARLWDRVK